jgi:hypothetical protein
MSPTVREKLVRTRTPPELKFSDVVSSPKVFHRLSSLAEGSGDIEALGTQPLFHW